MLAAAAAAAACGVGAGPAVAGVFSVGCDLLPPVKVWQHADPIKKYYPADVQNPSDLGHLHVFKGNKSISHSSTLQTLQSIAPDGSTCERNTNQDLPGDGDMSSYWAPTLIELKTDGTERRVPLVNSNTYYEAPHDNNEDIVPFPQGLKILAFDAKTEQTNRAPQLNKDPITGAPVLPYPFGARLTCGTGNTVFEYPSGAIECKDVTPTGGDPVGGIRLGVKWPSCMKPGYVPKAAQPGDAYPGDYDDSAAVAYPVQRGNKWVCPTGFEQPIPQLFVQFIFNSSGGPNYFLSHRLPQVGHEAAHQHSDSAHADFFNAWDPMVLQALVDDCLNTSKNCGASGAVPNPYLDSQPDPCTNGCVVAASLLAHWRFDETTGTVASDVTGLHDGEYRGRYELGAPGVYGTSAVFRDREPGPLDPVFGSQGVSGHLFVEDDPALRPGSGGWTIEGWTRFPSSNQLSVLYSKRQAVDPYTQQILFIGDFTRTGYRGQKLCLAVRESADRERSTCTASNVSPGAHHFAARVDPGDGEPHNRLTLYIDGNAVPDLVSVWGDDPWPNVSTTEPVYIGGDPVLEASELGPVSVDAEIDEMRVWDGALTTQQIDNIHATGSP